MSHSKSILETWCDMLIRGLWEIQTTAIIDVRFGDADAETYKTKEIDKIFPRWEQMKKYKYGQQCHDQQKLFSLSFLLLDGKMGQRDHVVLSTLVYSWPQV